VTKYAKSIEIYGDGIGKVQYIDHMGSDLTVVNSARALGSALVSISLSWMGVIEIALGSALVSISLSWMGVIENSSIILSDTATLLLWSIIVLPLNLLSLFMCVLSIIVIEHGPIMKFLEDTQIKISDFMNPIDFELNTNQTDKPQTPKN
jgi:hypothetical protein